MDRGAKIERDSMGDLYLKLTRNGFSNFYPIDEELLDSIIDAIYQHRKNGLIKNRIDKVCNS